MGMDEQQPQPYDDIAAASAPATPDALRSIVARHQRARTRTLGIALAIALVAGPIAGWAIGHAGGGGQQVATGSSPDKSNAGRPIVSAPVAAVPGEAFSFGGTPPKTTHLFTRTTSDGITIRAYRQDPPPPPPEATTPTSSPSAKTQQSICPKPMVVPGATGSGTPAGSASSGSGSASASASASSGEAGTSTGGGETAPAPPPQPFVSNGPPPPCAPDVPPICKAAPSVLAEVSNDAAVGQSFDAIDDKQPSDALSHLAVSGFGVPEGSPATFVTVQVGPGVTDVRLRLPSGSADEMAPVGGVAVLAVAGSQPPPDGTVVEALNAQKDVVGAMPVGGSGPKTAFACAYAAGRVEARPLPAPASPPTTR